VLDEDDLAVLGRNMEGGDALDPIDQRVELLRFQPQQVHRQRAGLDVDLADVLCLAEGLGLALRPGRRQGGHCGGALITRLRRQAVRLVDAIGAEGIERPVLEEDVDRSPESGGAGGQHGGRLQPVIGARKQH
jgi:hypothetical protein